VAGSDRHDDAGVVKQAGAVPRQYVSAGTATETQVLLGPDDGAPHFAMRRFIMGAGGGMPRHTNAVEHEQLSLPKTLSALILQDLAPVTSSGIAVG